MGPPSSGLPLLGIAAQPSVTLSKDSVCIVEAQVSDSELTLSGLAVPPE